MAVAYQVETVLTLGTGTFGAEGTSMQFSSTGAMNGPVGIIFSLAIDEGVNFSHKLVKN